MGAALPFIMQILAWIGPAFAGVQAAIEHINWGVSQVKKMVEEDRDPTDAEWDELNDRTDALRELLHSDEK